ncbi:MAG: class I SAM-dependent DNA methyltransferase [Candidatus Heimdallarchaeota archaeon]
MKKPDPVAALTFRSTAYVLIAQLLFYSLMQREVPNWRLLPINRIAALDNLRHYFDKVITVTNDYEAVFAPDVTSILKKLPLTSQDFIVERINDALTLVNAIDIESVQKDLLGQIFQTFIPIGTRKQLAAFYTRSQAARLLTRLCVRSSDKLILDPACGSGTILVAAYKCLKELRPTLSHQDLLNMLWGNDVAAFSTQLTAINLALQAPASFTEDTNILLHDFLTLSVGGLAQFFATKAKIASVAKRKSHEVKIPRFSLIVGNPPFTRGMYLSDAYKRKAGITGTRTDVLGLHSIFLLKAPDLLAQDGRLAFILPNSTVYADNMRDIWLDFLDKELGIELVIRSQVEEAFSDSSYEEIIVIARKEYKGLARFVIIWQEILNSPDTIVDDLSDKILGVAASCCDSVPHGHEISGAEIACWAQESLRKTWPWRKLFPTPEILKELVKNFTTLEEIDGVMVCAQADPRPAHFYMIPNNYWRIASFENNVVSITPTQALQDDKHISDKVKDAIGPLGSVEIPFSVAPDYQLLVEATRTTENYRVSGASPIIQTQEHPAFYLQLHPRDLEKNVKKILLKKGLTRSQASGLVLYVDWGVEKHNIRFRWAGVENRQARIGIPAALDLKSSRSLAFLFDKRVILLRAFECGLRVEREIEKEAQKIEELIFAFLTSSLFLLEFLFERRIKRANFSRVEQEDLKRFLVPDISQIPDKKVLTILEASKTLNIIPLASRKNIRKEIEECLSNKNHPRRVLDESWINALGLDVKKLREIYLEIRRYVLSYY